MRYVVKAPIRCGVFNLGGEGQFIVGSVACCYVATQSGIEGFPAIVLCLLAGIVAGGLWALIPGVLKVYRGQNEMIDKSPCRLQSKGQQFPKNHQK